MSTRESIKHDAKCEEGRARREALEGEPDKVWIDEARHITPKMQAKILASYEEIKRIKGW